MTIKMGNDEFILYIRKNFKDCKRTNDDLGKKIWLWIRENDPSSTKGPTRENCYWGKKEDITSETKLPYTAHQFEFSIDILPALYRQLEFIARS